MMITQNLALPVSVANGGTGASTQGGAQANLSVAPAAMANASLTLRAAGATQWASMPAALTELFAGTPNRARIDLSGGFTQARVLVRMTTAGAANAEIRIQYSTDESTWDYLDASSGPGANIGTSAGLKTSSWVNLTANAKADVYIRGVGINGDGATGPFIGQVIVQFR